MTEYLTGYLRIHIGRSRKTRFPLTMVQNLAFQDPPLEKLDNRTDTTLEWTHYVFFWQNLWIIASRLVRQYQLACGLRLCDIKLSVWILGCVCNELHGLVWKFLVHTHNLSHSFMRFFIGGNIFCLASVFMVENAY